MKAKPVAPWLGVYPVTDEAHHDQLEAAAAVNELRERMPREQAEKKAHEDYLRDAAYGAGAHHFLGVQAAVAAQAHDAARKHGAAYAAAADAGGWDPAGRPPQPVLDRMKELQHKVYSFKPHPADAFFPVEVVDGPKDPQEAKLHEKLEGLRKMIAALPD